MKALIYPLGKKHFSTKFNSHFFSAARNILPPPPKILHLMDKKKKRLKQNKSNFDFLSFSALETPALF